MINGATGDSGPLPVVQRMSEAAVLLEVDNCICQFTHKPTAVVRPPAEGVLPGAPEPDDISGPLLDGKLFLDHLATKTFVCNTRLHTFLRLRQSSVPATKAQRKVLIAPPAATGVGEARKSGKFDRDISLCTVSLSSLCVLCPSRTINKCLRSSGERPMVTQIPTFMVTSNSPT